MQPEGSYRVHRSPPLVPILSQTNPNHTILSYLILIIHQRLGLPSGLFPCGFLHVVQTGSGVHPISYPRRTGGSFPGVKRPGLEADHSPPTSAEIKKMWIYTSTPPYVFTMLGGSLVTTSWRVLRLRMKDTPSRYEG
ncbi:hypothetical protein B7P43_G08793 [Cryptotermes secundus]|uniref:Uncharacterized protein n=1 Tax=Cryptotermes secundus TaxID=105785 RepID=A0A2J7QA16_9NEOP|nr:hypothetical protein B7P43_G08793 [Cryptotermes secundus]